MAAKKKKNVSNEETGFSEIVRRFKANPFLYGGTVVILVLITIAFVFMSPMGAVQADRDEMVFGYYNGIPITRSAFFIQSLQEIAQMYGFDLNSDYSMNMDMAHQVWYQAFVRTAIHVALMEEMRLAGFKAPSEEIDRMVAGHPDFQEDGRFSVVKYNNYDRNRLMSLWRNTEENYTAGKYFSDLVGLKVSSAESNFIGAMAFPERSFEMVSFPRSAFPDSEIESFALANPNLFNTVHLSRITMANEREARQLYDSIQSGRTLFEDAARTHSTDTDKERGGDMGRRMAYEIFTELTNDADRTAVTTLRRGDVSPILSSPNDSWVFFRSEITPYAADLSQEEDLNKVRSYMNRFEGGRIENWLVAQAEEFLAAAGEQNLSLYEYVELQKELEAQALTRQSALASQSALAEDDAELPVTFLQSISTRTFGPINLNYGNLGGSAAERSLQLFPHVMDLSENPELASAVFFEVFWRYAFFTPLNTPSAPFALGESIAVITAVEETEADETSIVNIANFYTWGWMYSAKNIDMNNAFMASERFDNRFFDFFLPILFGNRAER